MVKFAFLSAFVALGVAAIPGGAQAAVLTIDLNNYASVVSSPADRAEAPHHFADFTCSSAPIASYCPAATGVVGAL